MDSTTTNAGDNIPSDKNPAVASVLCLFLGVFGVHRFYLGKIVSGIFQLITFGGLGIWCLVDLFLLAVGEFKDKDGHKLKGSERKGIALLLCYIAGFLGLHRFYVGKKVTAIAQLCTFGGLTIWWLIDLVLICADVFTDKNGSKLV